MELLILGISAQYFQYSSAVGPSTDTLVLGRVRLFWCQESALPRKVCSKRTFHYFRQERASTVSDSHLATLHRTMPQNPRQKVINEYSIVVVLFTPVMYGMPSVNRLTRPIRKPIVEVILNDMLKSQSNRKNSTLFVTGLSQSPWRKVILPFILFVLSNMDVGIVPESIDPRIRHHLDIDSTRRTFSNSFSSMILVFWFKFW